jgi:hypothetical protein
MVAKAFSALFLNLLLKYFSTLLNPLQTAGWEKILQPGQQGFLNAWGVTTQAVLLEKLVQQGYKLKM